MTHCHRIFKVGKEHFVCIGFTTKHPDEIPPDDTIHLCGFSKEQENEVKGKGECPKRYMLSMTPNEAINLAVHLIRTSTLYEAEIEKEKEK